MDEYDNYLRALDDEVAREREARAAGPSFFTALLDASERATRHAAIRAADAALSAPSTSRVQE